MIGEVIGTVVTLGWALAAWIADSTRAALTTQWIASLAASALVIAITYLMTVDWTHPRAHTRRPEA